jgi:ferredoxin
MPADDVEILEGDEEGVRRLNSLGPVRIERDAGGRVTGVLFKRCLRVFDEERRFAPVFDEADTTLVPCDTVLMAIGQTLDLSFIDSDRDGLQLTERGMLACDGETGVTAHPDVFVAGDAAYGPKLLIHAVASGKRVARAVHARLTGETVAPELVGLHHLLEGYGRERDYEKLGRAQLPCAPVEERLRSQAAQVERGLDEAAARREAARCFDCGVNPVFDGGKCVLCGGCVEVCPECCLKIVSFERLEPSSALGRLRRAVFGGEDEEVSAILKDEEACIRCALCAERCPNGAITMERFCFKAVSS